MLFFSAETRAFALLCALCAVGCSAPVVDDPADALGSTTEAILLVERVVTADGSTQTNVSAKFMRLAPAADPELAERVVGSRLDLPPAGECALISSAQDNAQATAALSAMGTLGPVELLDVGDLVVKTQDAVMPLAARAFPDAFGLVSGVVYTSRDAASDLPLPAKYELAGSGSSSFESFVVHVEAPAAPSDVRVGDSPLSDGLVLDAREAIVLRWSADLAHVAPPSAEDLVYADLTAASGTTLRCAFSDEGRGEIPASLLKSQTLMKELPAQATLSLHRVRLGSFLGAGIDVGEARFDLSTVGRVGLSAD